MTIDLMDTLVYDLETLRIPYDGKSKKDPTFEYSNSWKDYAGLGVSVLCCYSYRKGFNVFLKDELSYFAEFANTHTWIIGHNSTRFDDNVLAALGHTVKTTHDTLLMSWEAAGLDPNFSFPENDKSQWSKYSGFSLEVLSVANFGKGKLSKGELAPKNWQRGKYQEVVKYCLDDVTKTRDLLELGLEGKLWVPSQRRFLKFKT